MSETRDTGQSVLREIPANYRMTSGDTEVDLLLLEDGLAMTAWERMQANDDILNFGDSLRSAMERRNAKSQ